MARDITANQDTPLSQPSKGGFLSVRLASPRPRAYVTGNEKKKRGGLLEPLFEAGLPFV